ncbi:DUF1905 domain-containing protein [Roseivirga sp.]|uniref:DUF1905 domain-containing protein n=1 Tax=Roseivirga sp. TaxID=1964215 RepID=UPI003B515B64
MNPKEESYTNKITYRFEAEIWQHGGAGWFFVTLPKDISHEIRTHLKWQEEGWGRMKASATVKKIEWDTAIWFDTKADAYLLPVKADIRKKARLQSGLPYQFSVLI